MADLLPLDDAALKDYRHELGSYTQFEDLTEIPSLSSNCLREWMRGVKTEFVFWLAGPYATRETGLRMGLKPVSSMNNWWPSHAGATRILTLFWGRAPEPDVSRVGKVTRAKWHSSFDNSKKYEPFIRHLGASGCGFKIGEPPLLKELFHRYFTLMRMPLELKPEDKQWLEAHNYRHLDTGALAQYWINGWKPEKYSADIEYEYFNTNPEEWGKEALEYSTWR